eukprot:11895286-Karenia_brevis.AAC.1
MMIMQTSFQVNLPSHCSSWWAPASCALPSPFLLRLDVVRCLLLDARASIEARAPTTTSHCTSSSAWPFGCD